MSAEEAVPVLECYAGARHLECSPDQARRRLFAVNLAYVVPAGWYRFDVNGERDEFFLADKQIIRRGGRTRPEHLCRGALRLLRELHLHTVTHVTARDLRGPDESCRSSTRTAFIKQKNRLSSVLPSGVIECDSDAKGERRQVGYLFRRGLTRFMVLRVLSGRMTDADWEALLLPPTAEPVGRRHA